MSLEDVPENSLRWVTQLGSITQGFYQGVSFIRVKRNRSTLRSASSRCFASTILSDWPINSLLSVTVMNDQVCLIKGSDSDQEGDPNFDMYNTKELDLSGAL